MNKPFSVEILLLMTEQHLSASQPSRCYWLVIPVGGIDSSSGAEITWWHRSPVTMAGVSVSPIPHNLGHMLTPSKLQMVRGRVKLYLHSEKLIYFINTTTNCPHFLLWQDKQEIFYTADAKSCANQFLYHILFTGSENIKGWNVMV